MNLPKLDQSIHKIKAIRSGLNQHASPKTVAQVYLGGIGLLYHLKADQATLRRIRYGCTKVGSPPICPDPAEIPAISAVLHDIELFQALVHCLSTTVGSTGQETENGGNERPGAGRKRSLSFNAPDSSNASKLLKLHHSPVPSSRKVMPDISVQPGVKKPLFSIPVLAATVLYSTLQHLDHWPAPLVKAYADDTFGPRLWVDDEGCRCLVQNLALVHSAEQPGPLPKVENTAEKMVEASRIVQVYRSLHWKEDSSLISPPNNVRRGSMSSTGSAGNSQSRASVDKPQQSSDSDSGDEEEHMVTTAGSAVGKNGTSSLINGENTSAKRTLEKTPSNEAIMSREKKRQTCPKFYPLEQRSLNLARVRQRYFGANAEWALNLITTSLQGRLDIKSKQNSGLLQSLPAFVAIPKIRSLIASHLNKWLQSPALAGLARVLFSATVNQMQNADPPIPDDLSAIDSILAMRLKANQLNAHIENLTAIARRIPTAAVATHMYSKLFEEELELPNHGDTSDSSFLKMIGAIHKVLTPQISYEAIASTLLLMIVHPLDTANLPDRNKLVSKLRRLVRLLAIEFAPSFDGYLLMESLFALDVSSRAWSPRDEEDKARLMLQCVTLMMDPFLEQKTKQPKPMPEATQAELRARLASARMTMLKWCCADYGPRCSGRLAQGNKASKNDLSEVRTPNYQSALSFSEDDTVPSWLRTMRCLLFMEDSDSDLMKCFMTPGETVSENGLIWEYEVARIRLCCDFGRDITNESLWVVLKSSVPAGGGLGTEMTVQLLENLIECCGHERKGTLSVNDPMLVWEFYNLVQYTPPAIKSEYTSSDEVEMGSKQPNGSLTTELPRLAHPDLWWRVTIMALVLCGTSSEIGYVMWEEHPTLRALIKMVTSMRYRFPTIDCNEEQREEMKKFEKEARDKESGVAEMLFLPPKKTVKKTENLGSRVSRRLQKQQEDREAAIELAENTRRKKMLRTFQKSIMLWDPDGPARKPPREAADLLVSVEDLFELSNVFQRSKRPDYLSMTIGNTTRTAVERAYNWLVPIISRLPETIARLPSNTSCFLLLRTYGTDGEERRQLKELASPLLRHVQESLIGFFGNSDAVEAFELLMSDVASQNPDRRRCARRVLRDALVSEEDSNSSKDGIWMVSFLQMEHASCLVSCAVKYMAIAAGFERGGVLRSLIIALQTNITFSETHKIAVEWTFPRLLVELISKRPSVYAEAVYSFLDLRAIAVRVVHDEFARFATGSAIVSDDGAEPVIEVPLYMNPFSEVDAVKLPLHLIRATAVLLSVWKDEYAEVEKEAARRVDNLVSALMQARPAENEGNSRKEPVQEQNDVVPAELWIMLAKARSDSIAKKVALSAPVPILPRLLLCSGLSRSSFLTMMDRLGRLGENASEMDEEYMKLLEPSASSQWDIGRLGKKREILRKLLGRLSAYIQLYSIKLTDDRSKVSTTFLKWLSDTCMRPDMSLKKMKPKRGRPTPASLQKIVPSAVSLLHGLSNEDMFVSDDSALGAFGNQGRSDAWMEATENVCVPMGAFDASFVERCLDNNDTTVLEDRLRAAAMANESDARDLAPLLLDVFVTLQRPHVDQESCILRWVPRLASVRGNASLWQNLFSKRLTAAFGANLLSKCIRTWSQDHLDKCKDWICGNFSNELEDIDSERVAQFLFDTLHRPDRLSPASGESQLSLIQCYIAVSEHGLLARRDYLVKNASGQCSLPASFELGLVAGGLGKASFQAVCEMAMKHAEDCVVFRALILRLYLQHPSWMNLGLGKVRSLLMDTSASFASEWTRWQSSFDNQLDETIDSLRGGHLRLAKGLSDISRKHPLILLRKTSAIVAALECDANVTPEGMEEIRGTVNGRWPAELRKANFLGKIVQVKIKHWGYTFTEPVWLAFLDAVASAPKEVLFGCGLQIGFLDLLTVYMKLISVQLQLMTLDKSKRLKTKLSEMFGTFRQQNPGGWRQWLGSCIDNREVRHILVTCDFMTPQQAIESIRET